MSRRVTVLLLILLVLITAGAVRLRRTVPIADGQIHVAGLEQAVTVSRDEFGVPHIKAETTHDAYFALGYQMASDRLFQLELTRHAVSGRLSEWLGADFVEEDESLRRLGFVNFGIRFEATHRLSPEIRAAFDAYLDGLNAFVATGPIPLELLAFPYEREPFKYAESLAMVAYMGFGFAEAFYADPLKSKLYEKLGKDKVDALWTQVSPRTAAVAPAVSNEQVAALASFADRVLDAMPPPFSGSNGWVIAGNRSATGHPLLANDPHIQFSQPNVWWEAHVTAPGMDIHGHYLSLMPFPPLGITQTHAWGLTMYENDDMDLYAEHISEGMVDCNGVREPVRERQEVISIKGGTSKIVTVQETCHGPIVDVTNPDRPLALKWGMLLPENDPVSAFFGLAKANSVEQFRESLRTMLSPGLNILYADVKGHIALFPSGALPIRRGGDRIMDGTDPKDDWQGLVPFEDWPFQIDPPGGSIVSANNAPNGTGVIPTQNGPYQIHGHFQSPVRYRRVKALVEAQRVHDFASTSLIQNDSYMALGVQLRSLLAHKLPASPATEAFLSWNGDASTDSVGSTIALDLKRAVLRGLVSDEMGKSDDTDPKKEELTTTFMSIAISDHTLDRLMLEPTHQWWDDVTTAQVETRDDILLRAFAETVQRLTERFGSANPQGWVYGKVHTLTQKHPFGQASSLLGKWFDVGPYPVSGANESVNNMLSGRAGKGFAVGAGPSTRRMVDLVPDHLAARSVLPSGQSGHVMSSHYQDQAPLFVAGETREIHFGALGDNARHVLEMLP